MTKIISFPRRIDADDAIDPQLSAKDSTLASAIGELGQIVRVFQKQAVTSLVTAIVDLEYGTVQLRKAARLIEEDPLRKFFDAEILKIDRPVDEAGKSLSGSL